MAFFKRSKWGMLLLGIWLIVTGVLSLTSAVRFPYSAEILALLALAAGVLIVMDR